MKSLRACMALLLLTGHLCVASGEEYFARYQLPREARSLDLGLQPLGYPAAMIGAVIRRDRILKSNLEALGQPLGSFPFRRGADMVELMLDGRIEAGLIGDMPTIMLASRARVAIAGLVKRSETAVVSGETRLLASMRGMRFGYVPFSSAHYTLLQALASVGMGESDVTLVPLGIDEMPAALSAGRIDAFAAWEPAPSVALAKNPRARVVFRGLSSDYFVLTQRLIDRNPDAARQLVAGFVRALEWMRKSRANAETAARWALADGAAFSGKASDLTPDQAVSIARREILEVPSAPAIPELAMGKLPLQGEFEFLRKLGKLAPESRWQQLTEAFRYDGLERVSTAPAIYRQYSFDYEQ